MKQQTKNAANRTIAILTVIAIVLKFLSPYLVFGFLGLTFAEQPKTPLEPANFAFNIFFLIDAIFLGLGYYQLQSPQIHKPKFIRARIFIILNCLFYSLCLLFMAFELYVISLLLMVLLLVTLIRLANILELGKDAETQQEQWLVKLPIALYFGWMLLMLPIIVTNFLREILAVESQTFLNTKIWALSALGITFLIVVYQFVKRQVNLAYLLVIIWGLFGIFFTNINVNDDIAFTTLGLSIGLWVTYFIVERQQMELQKIQTELTALRNQVNPHFLFNSLNTLSNLIPLESEQAHKYLDKLAKFYRYVVSQREEHLIPLSEELEGVKHYIGLLQERFGQNLQVKITCEAMENKTVLPLSLQLLIENAVKHNIISERQQLRIHIFVTPTNNQLKVENNINERTYKLESTGMGLANIQKRYKLFTNQVVQIERNNHTFSVTLPLL